VLLILLLIGSIWHSGQGNKESGKSGYDPQAVHERVVAEAKRKKQQEADEAYAAATAEAARVAEAKQKTDQRKAERKAFVDEYRTMTVQQRLATVTTLCNRENGCEYPKAACLQEAAATPAEATQLKNKIASIEKVYEQAQSAKKAAEAQKARRTFASTYETVLLDRHMNPDGVTADGKSLRIRGWFCTRQFIYDFQKTTAETARALGFTKVDCNSGLEDWSVDL
jgi:hypothetical protein